MKIGLIGIGELGIAVCKNYIKHGYDLSVYDANHAAMDAAVEMGATPKTSSADLARDVDVVVTALPTPPIIEQVMIAAGNGTGVLDAMREGAVWIDHSTNDRELLMKIEQLADAKGVDMIEAPVTGGIPLAHEGKITVLAGAKPAVFEKYKHLLAITGDPVIHMGDVGSATIVKVMTNMLAFIHLWALGEGLMFGRAAGLKTGAVYEAILNSCGNSFVAETEGVPIMTGSYDYGFTMELAAKDMGIVLDIAERSGAPLQMGKLADSILRQGMETYGEKFWSTGIVKLLEDEMELDLRADGYETETRWAEYTK